jgi:hypothetical protein
MIGERVEEPVDDHWRAERTRGIVNQDNAFANGIETVSHAFEPFPTANEGNANVKPAQRRSGQLLLPFANHDPDMIHARMSDERFDRSREQGLAAEQPVLFRHAAAEALSAAGGDDEGGDGGFGHPARLARSPPLL